jgi:outer membrane protein
MKKPIHLFTVLTALFALGTTILPAAPNIQLVTVDLSRALNEYWKTQKKSGEFVEKNKSAQEQVDEVQKRMAAILEEGRKLVEDANNPALNEEAKNRIMGDAARKEQELQSMRERLGQFVENTERQLDQDRKLFMELMFGEINTVVQNIGRERGANVIIDTSVRSVLYADPSFDITDAVITELNKSKPADFVPPAQPSK